MDGKKVHLNAGDSWQMLLERQGIAKAVWWFSRIYLILY